MGMGTGSFPGVKRPGRGVDHPPPSQVPRSRKSRVIPLLTLWAFMACYGSTIYNYTRDIRTFVIRDQPGTGTDEVPNFKN